ncbi:tryptophan-rich sensory protein [bacterium]|nr:tryptophan-rich sensory protein [bacterium]
MFNSDWYNNLTKPMFSPPSKLFAPVWTILYGTIIIALIIYAFTLTHQKKLRGYIYFTIQMILNLLWTPAFFYFQNIGLALAIIILLDIFVILTIKNFYSVSRPAGLILIPYLIWIIFATYLNIGYFVLN